MVCTGRCGSLKCDFFYRRGAEKQSFAERNATAKALRHKVFTFVFLGVFVGNIFNHIGNIGKSYYSLTS